MALIDPNLGLRLIFILGITNIIGLLLVLLSCRCIPGIANKLFRYGWYKKFYIKHCYFWWLFVGSVLLHTALAFLVFGIQL